MEERRNSSACEAAGVVAGEGTAAFASVPRRVQLSRAKGWRMPPNTVKVDRTTKWGNPFIPGKPSAYSGGRPVQDKRHAFVLYRAVAPDNEALVAAARAELKGKNLACWCPVERYP